MTPQFEVPTVRSANLSSAQLAMVLSLSHIAGLPPVSGYGTAVLATAVASDPTFLDMLPSVDFDDAGSVASAVQALLEWRQRTFGCSRTA